MTCVIIFGGILFTSNFSFIAEAVDDVLQGKKRKSSAREGGEHDYRLRKFARNDNKLGHGSESTVGNDGEKIVRNKVTKPEEAICYAID